MKRPLYFSVIIPLHNKKPYIERTLQSVLAQTYKHFEIIIVNDGSNDGGELIAARYKNNNIHIIHQLNSGVSAARNNGMLAARHDFVCLLDADDTWMPEFLQEIVNLIHDFPDHHIFSLRHQIIDSDGQLIYPKVQLNKSYRGAIDNFTQLFAKSNGLINASSVCLRKSYCLGLGGFPAGYNQGEDIYLWIRYGLNTRLVFYNKVGSCYFRNSSNRSINRFTAHSLPYHFTYFYTALNHKDFSTNYSKTKVKHLTHYLRKQASAHIAQLIILDKRELAMAHVQLLYDLNKATGRLCYLITLLPCQALRGLKFIRKIRRLHR